MDESAGGTSTERVDLLTAVMHELGHILGLPDIDDNEPDVMFGHLNPGQRHTSVHELDAVYTELSRKS